jgi:hypothetical protein
VTYFMQESSYEDNQNENDKHHKKVSLGLHRTAFIDRAAAWLREENTNLFARSGEKLDGHIATLFDALSLKEAKQKGHRFGLTP